MKRAIPARQRGISLFIVLIILLLSLMAVLGGLAVANLNESLVGNQSDTQRAYAAAQALLDAAQIDIRLNNGLYCNAGGLGDSGTNSIAQTGSPSTHTPCVMRYPRGLYASGPGVNDGYTALLGLVGGFNQCGKGNFVGVCISNSPVNAQFQITAVNKGGTESLPNGAIYNNSFISSVLSNTANWGNSASVRDGTDVTQLALKTGNFRGAYWVEVFPYAINSTALRSVATGMSNVPVPDGTYPFIFRITAMGQGLKNNTVSVLRTYYVPYPAAGQ